MCSRSSVQTPLSFTPAGTYADQPAALKLLLLDEETAHAILNEVRLCLKLNHKNLVQLLDCAVVATNKQAVAAGFPVSLRCRRLRPGADFNFLAV